MPEQEQPIDPKLREQMEGIGRALDAAFNAPGHPKKLAFALFLFPFDNAEDHRSNYISNGNREDMIATLKEFIARAEGTYVEPRRMPGDADTKGHM